MASELSVAVVIPSWNSAGLLPRCLDSLAGQGAELELLVVDNGSSDGSVELLRERGVPYVSLPENIGFAAAVNLGAARTEAPAVLALNADTVLEPGAVGRLAEALAADPGLGGVQPRILQLEPGVEGEVERARLYSRGMALSADGRAFEEGAGEAQDSRGTAVREVFGVCGAACLLRRELFAQLGGYDERYFAFYEDVDLNVRARIAGWRFAYVPEAVAGDPGRQARGPALAAGPAARASRAAPRGGPEPGPALARGERLGAMKVCLIAPAPNESGATAHSPRALAKLLSQRHEVTLIHSGWGEERPDLEPVGSIREVYADLPEELAPLKFACEDHRHSAAAMAAIRRLYADGGPDLIEVPDFRAHGLVPLQARRGGDPLLAETTIAVRISPSTELLALQDGTLQLPRHKHLAEIEREQLRLGDRLLWSGGDCLGLYRRYYGDEALPTGVQIRPAIELPTGDRAAAARADGPLRLLFVGDLRRSRGVVDLVEACRSLPSQGWHLTLLGEDTTTAGMGQSIREVIEVFSGEDPRIEFAPELDATSLRERFAAADLLVVPSRLEATAGVAVAGLAAGVPVLATPVGDLVEVVEDGVSGWHAEDTGSLALGRALRRLEADRGELTRVRDSGAPAARARELTDPEPILAAYDELLGSRAYPVPVKPVAAGGPLVTGIVPYFRAHQYVRDAVGSLLAQTYPEVEVLIVNDGSFAPDDAVLAEYDDEPRVTVVTQPNGGEGTARTLGARIACGDYLVMLDADNLLEPDFVARALAVFLAEPDLAYVTCWLRMVGPDNRDTDAHPNFAPLGNSVLSAYAENWDGDTLAMLPRRVFTELGFEYHPEGSMHSDWELYRWLRASGHFGTVIPERLARYRVLPDSIMRGYSDKLQDRSWQESEERISQHAVRWTAEAPG